MKANAKKGKKQTGTISTLDDIAARHAENCKALLKLGGVETVLQAMIENLEDPSVQHTGCRVLLNAALCTQQTQEAVVKAMTAHPAEVHVQEAGCRALKEFAAYSSANQERVASVGGLPAVLCAMKNHTASPRVQEFACGVLRNMC